MNEGLDLTDLTDGQFAIVLDEINTGIILDTKTLERCRDGKADFVVAPSLDEAIAISKAYLDRSEAIEIMIFNAYGQFVQYVRRS